MSDTPLDLPTDSDQEAQCPPQSEQPSAPADDVCWQLPTEQNRELGGDVAAPPSVAAPPGMAAPPSFQDIILALQHYWSAQGCVVLQPYDMEVGAGTFHPATCLRSLGPGRWKTAYVQPCRRPTDGRYGENPNRLQHYYQFQVIIKPSPDNIQELYLGSLRAIGIEPRHHDVRFVEDDWESPTLGAWGLGWEVWLNGMEVTQFTYFQQVGGIECDPVPVEITYGLERLAMYVQGVQSMFDLVWSAGNEADPPFTYGDVFLENEREFSAYNFEAADTGLLAGLFDSWERECLRLLGAGLPLPAYDCVLRCSHVFNLLDARGAISTTERMGYILRVRGVAKSCCVAYAEKCRKAYQDGSAGLALGVTAAADEGAAEAAGLADADASDALKSLPALSRFHEPATLVFEIGTEEIPSTPLYAATEQLRKLADTALAAVRLEHGAIVTYSTPRRLVLEVRRLAPESTALIQRFRGPSVAHAFDSAGAPTKAALGFARSKGVDVRDLTRGVEEGNEYVFATVEQIARPTERLLPGLLSDLIDAIEWPKSQRWGQGHEHFSRPIRWLCALWGKQAIEVHHGGLVAGRMTRGHSLIAPEEVLVPSADDYQRLLAKAWVISSAEMRAARISDQVKSFEEQSGLHVYMPKATFAEVVNLVEFPTVLVGTFDAEFLEVPPEMLIDTLLSHQRYFPVYDDQRCLTNRFLVVSNGSPAHNSAIIAGHQLVVRPRLADASFFYHEDLKVALENRVVQLEQVVFHEKLGTLADKTARLESLVTAIAQAAAAPLDQVGRCIRAAHLSKADLLTHAVVEFTALQGIMGAYYARAGGDESQIAAAIREQYRPRFAGDELPASFEGRVLALADKMDTLAAIIACGQAPTGSSDPFALRRGAIGIINILADGLRPDSPDVMGDEPPQATLSLAGMISSALDILAASGIRFDRAETEGAIRAFFSGRLEVMLRESGVAADTVAAIMATGVIEPATLFERSRILEEHRQKSPELIDDLASAFARANNLRNAALGSDVDESLFGAAEAGLYTAIVQVSESVADALGKGQYQRALGYLASLRAPIDRFFEDVLIMEKDDKLRENRLRLLNRFVETFTDVADIGKLAG